MLLNYLKVTIRNLWREKVNAFINIIGLSVGIACAILIIIYVTDELTFDSFHSKADNLYRVKTIMSRGGEERVEGMAPFVFATTAKAEIPEIEAISIHTSYGDVIEHNGESFRETMTLVGEDFFKMFDFEVIDGSVSSVFSDAANIVITRATAVKFFGTKEADGPRKRNGGDITFQGSRLKNSGSSPDRFAENVGRPSGENGFSSDRSGGHQQTSPGISVSRRNKRSHTIGPRS